MVDLNFLRAKAEERKKALLLQKQQEQLNLEQAKNNLNAIEGALQDVAFWEGKFNEDIIEDKAVEEQLREQGVELDCSAPAL